MAVSFRPEIWAAELLVSLRQSYVYASDVVVNRDYEGQIANEGDTVHINSIDRPTIRDYTEHGTITWEQLSDTDRSLVIDQADYFAFKVDDIEKRQAVSGFVAAAAEEASVGMVEETDDYIADTMVAAVNGTSSDLGAKTVDISDASGWAFLVSMRSRLNTQNVPRAGRWMVIPDALTAAIIQDARFVDASAAGSDATLREGEIGRAAGFTILESNNVPEPTSGIYHVLAGHRMATTFAEQINQVETIRLENQFGDGVRGLHLYGAKVTRPEALVLASVTVQA